MAHARIRIGLLLALLTLPLLGGCGDDEPKEKSRPPLDEYLRRMHMQGMSPEFLRGYPKEQTQALGAAFIDYDWGAWQENVVLAIGMTAREGSADPSRLIAFLHAPTNPPDEALDGPMYQAKQNVLLSLGYMAYYTGNTSALTYLENRALPSAWKDEDLRWRSPFGEGKDVMRHHLAKLAVLGLAQSGRDRAIQRLVNIRKGNHGSTAGRDTTFVTDEQTFLKDMIERAKRNLAKRTK